LQDKQHDTPDPADTDDSLSSAGARAPADVALRWFQIPLRLKRIRERRIRRQLKRESEQRLSGAGKRYVSPLMVRILVVNMIALMTFVGGILYLNSFRENLIDNRMADLVLQGEIIAGALGESAVRGDASELLDLPAARQIITRLVGPTDNRVRLFEYGGNLQVDSQFLEGVDRIIEENLLPSRARSFTQFFEGIMHGLLDFFLTRSDAPPQIERPGLRAGDLLEVEAALAGETATQRRRRMDGLDVINVAVPVQRFRRVVGAILLTAETNDIESVVRAEQIIIMRIFSISFVFTALLSFFLARTVARPVRMLAEAAEEVRYNPGKQRGIPEFALRRDEIGDLSRALSSMTLALYNQIDAVESFAADVAHELKNPLTSMRSALETMENTDRPDIQARLQEVMREDVRRLDRLITDISEASRLDAELTRAERTPVDIPGQLSKLIASYESGVLPAGLHIKLHHLGDVKIPLFVAGSEDRLGQVWRNLIDNAISFSPAGGTVHLLLWPGKRNVRVQIADEGPGVPDYAAAKIFKRFYSERPGGESFGKHSGLGLAICQQIVEAHGGHVEVGDLYKPLPDCDPQPRGAVFDVALPRMMDSTVRG